MLVTKESLKNMRLNEIALLIEHDWVKPSPHAVPFIGPMGTLNSIEDRYFADTGLYIVSYFLSNASTYRGDLAKLIKAELKARIATYEKKLNKERSHG